MSAGKFTREITVPCYDADKDNVLRPAAMLNYMQDVASDHCDAAGYGWDELLSRGLAWVVSKMHVEFLRHPLWRETIEVSTWHKGHEGIYYVRDFEVRDKSGETCAKGTSSWIIVDIDKRKLAPELGIASDPAAAVNEDAIAERCPKIRPEKGLEFEYAFSHTVNYSDVDRVGHANNAMYTVWAMDAIGYEWLSTHKMSDIMINFISESHAGQTVDIYRSKFTDERGRTVFIIEGRRAEEKSFITKIVF